MSDIVERPVCIKGIGFDSRTGGFAAISVDGVEFSSEYIGKCSKHVKEWENIAHNLSIQAGNLAAELTALNQAQGEPVGEVFGNRIKWSVKAIPIDGTKLYTSAPTIPEGWQLVPINPTNEMILAAVKGQSNRTTVPRDDELAAGMYYDMLAAAPAGPRPADYKPEDVK